ncbi:pyridoxal kinase PdxY [Aquamicrobium ahrensii]|uniref:pyridoxal kinase n=1 Tax=Aquamicrobium ahrensii TaxID=469551 RepID=A0ABV2KMQ2_9HYPH
MSAHLPEPKPAVIVISSHVVRGTVGNRAAVFALEALGFPVWEVPTVILPWHPGHGPGTRIVAPPEQFVSLLKDLEGSRWLGEVKGVLSGFLGDYRQAEAVASLVRAVKARNPEALYACDPVMGDVGGLYVPQQVAEAMRDQLMPLADIATPNRYELAWLAGRDLPDRAALAEAARAAPPKKMLVTSSPASVAGRVGNLLVEGGQELFAEHDLVSNPPNGVGDLTASLYLARVLGKATPRAALRATTASVYEVLQRAASRGSNELQIETDAQSLLHPSAEVVIHHGEPATHE